MLLTSGGRGTTISLASDLPGEPWVLVGIRDGKILDGGESLAVASTTPGESGDTVELPASPARQVGKLWQRIDRQADSLAPRPVPGARAKRRERALGRIEKLLENHPDAAVVALDQASHGTLRQLGHSHIERLLLPDPDRAGRLLSLLRERGEPWTYSAALASTGAELAPPVRSHIFPPRRPAGRRRAVFLTAGDPLGQQPGLDRAAALAAQGYDTVLLGLHPDDRTDLWYYRGALVQRIRVPRDSPRSRARARSRAASARIARLSGSDRPAARLAAGMANRADGLRRWVTATRLVVRVQPQGKLQPNETGPDGPRPAGLTLGFGRELERLRPDTVHVLDDRLLRTAEDSAARLAAAGHQCTVARDAVPDRAQPLSNSRRDSPQQTPARPNQVLIGPANHAGQADAWARALRNEQVPAAALQVIRPDHAFRFPAGLTIRSDDWEDSEYRISAFLELLPQYSHFLLDGGRPMFELGPDSPPDVRQLERSERTVGLVFHGSELRDPDRHARQEPWSPFADPANTQLTGRLRKRSARTRAGLAHYTGPVLVSTPDLLDDLPSARWLPVVVDPEFFRPGGSDPGARRVPVVAHAPSSAALKGSAFIDPILSRLDAEGVIRYLRLTNVPHSKMPELIRSADLVADQVLMNLIGVGAAETMASGRVCVAHLSDELADRFPQQPPVVDATPETLEQAVRELAADPERRRELGNRGREYAMRVHDGRLAAQVLIDALDLVPEQCPTPEQ